MRPWRLRWGRRRPPCTRHSRECDFWTWDRDAVRPACCTAFLKEVLFYTEDLLTRRGIVHWIDYGTLLGAVRNQELIPWDWDVDFGVYAEDAGRIRALEAEVARDGYDFETSEPFLARVNVSRRNRLHTDLFAWSDRDGEMRPTLPWYAHDAFPRTFLESFAVVHLYGRPFPAPSPVHDFLVHRYGEGYLTPRRMVLTQIPHVPPEEITPRVEALLEAIRERDVRIWQLERGIGHRVERRLRGWAGRVRRR